MSKTINAIDLFAGLGGWSTGAVAAGCNVVWAANHWPTAVEWHSVNHPGTAHICQDLHQADWSAVPAHDLLMASPCCHGHSKARGKDRPQHDASRSTAWAVVSAAEYHRPEVVLVENVPEFADWTLYGPWRMCMEALGYSVAPHIVDVADLGVPQHRTRMVLVCTKSEAPLMLNLPQRPHIHARQIVDFESGKWSPINKPGRSEKTLARIDRGRAKYGDVFVFPYYSSGSGLTGRSLDRPVGTMTTKGRWALVEGDRMRMFTVDECRRAQGFPEDTALPKQQHLALHLLGNAVPPPMATEFIDAVKEAA
ncbi:MAG: DNA cytosine methyltransferase [Gammaproteobacteria bacterium]|nr:MAG: DNA cytosine methyltransferase [Gammaproteobacteria bacterium]